MKEFLEKAKESSNIIATLSGAKKNKLLEDISTFILRNIKDIEDENKKDMQLAKENNLSDSLIDRLFLDESRIKDMAQAVLDISKLKEPVGRIIEGWTTSSDLNIQKVSVPIGVIGIIYESRPNVTSDAAALCIKSGNVCILKGGKEAQYSNEIIAKIIQMALSENDLPKYIVSILPDASRQGVARLIKEDKFVDLIIPRGGSALIEFVSKNASVPVVKHDKGLCNTYIHKNADLKKAIDVCINAKCRRVGICGAMENLIVDSGIAGEILPLLEVEFKKHNTLLKGCEKTLKILKDIKEATLEDFATEYLDNILSIKIVENENEAIEFIRTYGSGHSDAIITEDYGVAEIFLNSIDSACVYLNASTQFTDGGEFGFGAEVGISTNKLHARGPMGINELTTYKFKILGNGNTRK